MPTAISQQTQKSIYTPHLMTVAEAIDEAPGIRTLKLTFQDEAASRNFSFKAGQFGEYSAFGAGESVFCIASGATRKGYVECSFQKVGRVTRELADV